MKTLYIVGAGSVGGHIASNPELYNLSHERIVFIDDNSEKIGRKFCACDVIGPIDFLLDIDFPVEVVIGIAFPRIKVAIVEKLEANTNISFPSLVATNTWVSKGVEIGSGSIIYPQCSINYGSILKDFVVVNMNCALGHHASVGSFSSLAPGVNFGGHTSVGVGVDVGIGVSTVQGVSIGDYSVIGGQAMVTKSFGADSKIVGIPGRNINATV